MSQHSTTDKPDFICVARRHMDAEFRVYDAMLAIAKAHTKPGQPLADCYARIGTLCNMVDRNRSTVTDQIRKLEATGWIISRNPTNAAGQKMRRKDPLGRESSDSWKVVEHEEYSAQHGCPALRFDESGRPLEAGRMPPKIERTNIVRMLAGLGLEVINMPPALADTMANAIAEKRASTGKPVQAKAPSAGNPVQASTGKPVQARTEEPVQARTGNPVHSLKVELEKQPPPPQPESPAPENGAVDRAGEEDSAKIEQWKKDHYGFMGAETNKSRAALASLISKHGPGVVLKALDAFDRRPGGHEGVKNEWALFFAEAESLIDNLPNPELEAEKQALQEASCIRQAAENWKQLNAPGKSDPNCVEFDILSLPEFQEKKTP